MDLKLRNVPFNIVLLSNKSHVTESMVPINSLSIMDHRSADFHPQGLYSNIIFGEQGTDERDRKYAYIYLKTPVFHPLYFKELHRLKSLYSDIIMGRAYATWNEKEKDFERATQGILDGETGFSFFIKHFPNLVFKQGESKERQLRIQLLEKYRDRALIKFFIVIPAGLRDVQIDEESRPVEEEINPLYRRIISAANTIPANLPDENSMMLDGPRRSMQTGINAVFDYIFNILEGKKGFLSGKFGSRRVFGTTRNVISAMETDDEILGSPRGPDMNTTIVGLFQFLKAAEPLIAKSEMKRGFMAQFFEEIDQTPMLVNKKTLKAVPVSISAKMRDKWGTEAGIEGLINGFKYPKNRHLPVQIDGHYLKLIYQDDKNFRVMDSIDDLKEGYDKANVRPMTYAEMFYINAYRVVKRTRCFNTRYPVTGPGSIYPNKVYVKTTSKALRLTELDINWQPIEEEAYEFPMTVGKGAFHDTQVVHNVYLPHLGADFDGDTLSFSIVHSDEAVKEIDDLLNSKTNYLSTTGSLNYDVTTDVTDWVLSFMTGNGQD